jgi:hypothetical protein
MKKQEIIDYNKVNLEKLSAEERELILSDYTEIEPYYFKGNLHFHWYTRLSSGEYESHTCKPTKYTCTIIASDGSMWQFGFNNRNRLRNKVKQIQAVNENVIAKVIAIQEVSNECK